MFALLAGAALVAQQGSAQAPAPARPEASQRGGFREPIGEPRVTRNREPAQRAQRPTDVDVPEFMPRF